MKAEKILKVIELRPEELDLIEKARRIVGLARTSFIRMAALERARSLTEKEVSNN